MTTFHVILGTGGTRRHRTDCPGGDLCTLDRWESCDVARRRRWKVGDVLEGDEGQGPTRITLRYISPDPAGVIVAASEGREGNWTLSCRCWGKVA